MLSETTSRHENDDIARGSRRMRVTHSHDRVHVGRTAIALFNCDQSSHFARAC